MELEQLDKYIKVEHEERSHKPFRAVFPPGVMPDAAYDQLRSYLHFSGNGHDEEAKIHASRFKELMGFDITDLQKRQSQLEDEASGRPKSDH